jgi:hypothetical protein
LAIAATRCSAPIPPSSPLPKTGWKCFQTRASQLTEELPANGQRGRLGIKADRWQKCQDTFSITAIALHPNN